MTWTKNIKNKVVTVLSLVLLPFQVVLYYLTLCFQMVHATGDLPISAFFQKEFERYQVPDMAVQELELWNCFSYWPSVHCFDWLDGLNGKYMGIDKKFYHGKYLFTIDWAHPDTNILDTEHSEIPQEHKCAHILALDNGNFAGQPNNRLLWHVNSYTVDNSWPDYKVQTTYWDAEDTTMVTEDTDKMFYQMEDKNEPKS